ncbi:hypothetical protein [Nitrososphaera viennensis]|nr:hypothetical protein [Nitrososphaera viennensis]UVS70213.1 hypothetical protein NWT39_05350 [Nitrososphaera viennensis]
MLLMATTVMMTPSLVYNAAASTAKATNSIAISESNDNHQQLLTANTDRGTDVYTNNEAVIVSGTISRSILKEGESILSRVYYPDGTLYQQKAVGVLADGKYTYRVEMDDFLGIPAGEYRVVVSYADYQAETRFVHVIEYGENPEAVRVSSAVT